MRAVAVVLAAGHTTTVETSWTRKTLLRPHSRPCCHILPWADHITDTPTEEPQTSELLTTTTTRHHHPITSTPTPRTNNEQHPVEEETSRNGNGNEIANGNGVANELPGEGSG